MAENSLNHLG